METPRQKEIFEKMKPTYRVENGRLFEIFYNSKGKLVEKERFPKKKNGTYVVWVDGRRRESYIENNEIVVIFKKKTEERQKREAEKREISQACKDLAKQKLIEKLSSHLQNDEWRLLEYNERKCDRFVINREGRIKDVLRDIELPVFTTTLGYNITNVVFDDKKRLTIFVHRAVACTFLEKIEGKNEINHKDLDKLNNRVENLEWCTRTENMAHYYSSMKYTDDASRRVWNATTVWYNNGITNRRIKPGQEVPEGFTKGKIHSHKQDK